MKYDIIKLSEEGFDTDDNKPEPDDDNSDNSDWE